jgi:hypothetical protein
MISYHINTRCSNSEDHYSNPPYHYTVSQLKDHYGILQHHYTVSQLRRPLWYPTTPIHGVPTRNTTMVSYHNNTGCLKPEDQYGILTQQHTVFQFRRPRLESLSWWKPQVSLSQELLNCKAGGTEKAQQNLHLLNEYYILADHRSVREQQPVSGHRFPSCVFLHTYRLWMGRSPVREVLPNI